MFMMRLKYSENPFLKINLFENHEHSLENEVLSLILEYFSESEIDPDQIIKALKESFFGKWIDGDILKPKMVGLLLRLDRMHNGQSFARFQVSTLQKNGALMQDVSPIEIRLKH